MTTNSTGVTDKQPNITEILENTKGILKVLETSIGCHGVYSEVLGAGWSVWHQVLSRIYDRIKKI